MRSPICCSRDALCSCQVMTACQDLTPDLWTDGPSGHADHLMVAHPLPERARILLLRIVSWSKLRPFRQRSHGCPMRSACRSQANHVKSVLSAPVSHGLNAGVWYCADADEAMIEQFGSRTLAGIFGCGTEHLPVLRDVLSGAGSETPGTNICSASISEVLQGTPVFVPSQLNVKSSFFESIICLYVCLIIRHKL